MTKVHKSVGFGTTKKLADLNDKEILAVKNYSLQGSKLQFSQGKTKVFNKEKRDDT